MPIRFRCGHCNQLLGIARRKAGSVVNCPKCHQQLVVPSPEGQDALAAIAHHPPTPQKEQPRSTSRPPEPPPGGFVFERSDFEELLRPALEPVGRSKKSEGNLAPEIPLAETAVPTRGEFPFDLSQPAATPLVTMPEQRPGRSQIPRTSPRGVLLSVSSVIVLAALALGGMIFAFGGGLLVGRYFLSPR